MGRMRFVVTGTGRSGTMHTAKLLSATGLKCGHEDYFRAAPSVRETGPARHGLGRVRGPVGRSREWARRMFADLDGDASWMAVPRLPRFRGLKVLQVRHPLPVIRSFGGTEFFSRPDRYGGQASYARAFFDATGDDLVDAMRWWVYWNGRAAEYADMTIQLETLDSACVSEVLDRLGEADPERRAQRAVEEVSAGSNSSRSRGSELNRLELSDLPVGPDLEALWVAARRFGYELDQEPQPINS